jgi:DNA-binding NarL/FixJ family response regulator
VLARHSDIEVIGEAANGHETLRQVQELQPTVLILDMNLPDISGLEVIIRLNQMTGVPRPRVLVLSAHCDSKIVKRIKAAGVLGYLLKDEGATEIVAGVRMVARGLPVLSDCVLHQLFSQPHFSDELLTERENKVLELMASGHNNTQIAEILFIALGTVKNHITNIYKKLPHVKTRAQAVTWAWKNELVTRESEWLNNQQML